MTNRNLIQHRAQRKSLVVMIGICCLDSQHEDTWSASCQCWLLFFQVLKQFFFQVQHNEQNNHSNKRPQHGKWTRKDNKLALYCYSCNNPTKRWYRRIIFGIWKGFAIFKTTNQRLAEQVRTITKNLLVFWP